MSRVNDEVPRLSKLHEDAQRCSKDFQQVWYELEMFTVCRDDMLCDVKKKVFLGVNSWYSWNLSRCVVELTIFYFNLDLLTIMSSAIQSAMDRRNNLSPHSPASRHQTQSPIKKSNNNSEQNQKAKLRLTSPAVQTLNNVIEKIFARALVLQPVDPIAFVAESIRSAGLEHSQNKQNKQHSKFLPPVRPTISNTKKAPRRHQHR